MDQNNGHELINYVFRIIGTLQSGILNGARILEHALQTRPGMNDPASVAARNGMATGIRTSSYYTAKEIEQELKRNGVTAKAMCAGPAAGLLYYSKNDIEKAEAVINRYYRDLERGGSASLESVDQYASGRIMKVEVGKTEADLLAGRLSREGILFYEKDEMDSSGHVTEGTVYYAKKDAPRVEQIRVSVAADMSDPVKAGIYTDQYQWKDRYMNELRLKLNAGLKETQRETVIANERGEHIVFKKDGFRYVTMTPPKIVTDVHSLIKSWNGDEKEVRRFLREGTEGSFIRDLDHRTVTRTAEGFEFTDVDTQGSCRYSDAQAVRGYLMHMCDPAKGTQTSAPVVFANATEYNLFLNLPKGKRIEEVNRKLLAEGGRPELGESEIKVLASENLVDFNIYQYEENKAGDVIAKRSITSRELVEEFGISKEEVNQISDLKPVKIDKLKAEEPADRKEVLDLIELTTLHNRDGLDKTMERIKEHETFQNEFYDFFNKP